MRRKWKTVLTVFMSTVALVLALSLASALLMPKHFGDNVYTMETWRGFYNEPRDSIDVLYVGSSMIYYGVAPTEIFAAHGITGYDLSAPYMRYIVAEAYIKEALRYQKPKLVVLSSSMFHYYNFDFYESAYRAALDPMRFSWDKLKVAYRVAAGSEKQTLGSYLFPLLRYHDRWTEVSAADVAYLTEPWRNAAKGWTATGHVQPFELSAAKLPTDEVTRKYTSASVNGLRSIVKLCEENDLPLLILSMPLMEDLYTYPMLNGVHELFDEMGLDYLELNTPEAIEAIGLELSTDFYDAGHLNVYGAAKATAYIGDYIASHYDLPDRRGQAGYEQWDADVLDARIAWLEALNNEKAQAPITIRHANGAVRLEWPTLKYYDSVRIQRQGIGSDTVETLADGERIAEYTDASVTAPCEYTVTFTVAGREDRPVRFTVAYQDVDAAP